mgnify:CR=1 FL=1
MSSARASSDTQMKQFERDIIGWQRDAGGWIVRLCKIWLQFRALVDPQLTVARMALKWPPILDENKETRLKYLTFAKDRNLLTDETALQLTYLVENPEEEVEEAQQEADVKQEKMMAQTDAGEFGGRLNQEANSESGNV